MNQQLNKQLHELTNQLKAAEAADDHLEVAAVLSRRAGVYALRQQWREAAVDLGRVAGLAAVDGEHFYQARALYGQAKVLGNLPERREEARQLLQQAAILYDALSDQHHQAEALLHVAQLYMGDDNYPAALVAAENAIKQLEQAPAAGEMLVELHQLRVTAYLFSVKFDAALAELETAVSIANTNNLTQQAVELRHHHQTLQSLVQGETPQESLESLLQAAQAAGSVQVIEDLQLQQAQRDCENGRYPQAIQSAAQIIESARVSTDLQRFIRYFYASLIIAQAEEAQGNRVGVLAALLRCKVYLETHLDKGLGLMMDKLLDNLKQQWGADGLRQTVAEYQAWVAENGPVMA